MQPRKSLYTDTGACSNSYFRKKVKYKLTIKVLSVNEKLSTKRVTHFLSLK